MTATPSDPDPREQALKSLLAWWEDAGFDPDELERPAPQPAARTAPPRAANASPSAPRQAKSKPRAATPQAAMAAGFGEAPVEGPSARDLAGQAKSLPELYDAIKAFDGCALKRSARNTVIYRGDPTADVMVIGEGPGREEDEQGKPFVGRSGQLLDRMFASIGLSESDLYITNIVNWRPPGNRAPTQEEIAQCLPLIERHIAIKKPKLIVMTGGVSAQSLLRATVGIMRLRGRWADYRIKDESFEPTEDDIPALPMLHPAYLLRRPQEKRLAWRDLLALKARLDPIG